jgi:hypothetical protein
MDACLYFMLPVTCDGSFTPWEESYLNVWYTNFLKNLILNWSRNSPDSYGTRTSIFIFTEGH